MTPIRRLLVLAAATFGTLCAVGSAAANGAGSDAHRPPADRSGSMTDGGTIPLSTGTDEFASLSEGKRIADFAVECVYENENGMRVGGRFRHLPSGFVLDVLRIQSVPQAFVWVNTPPLDDKGEPHTLEHLLLGKGTKGRFVASLEDMSLGESSAYTEQWRTCYHFHTSAGSDVFFHLFEEKLDAMLHPTYSDEEIRREVCNMGITESQDDGRLGLEEKGTVYNEMVSSYERPWGYLWDEVPRLLYGTGHPMAVSSGGEPAAIRELTPEEIRRFHGSTHHLNNMGAVVSIGDELSLPDCLHQISGIFARTEPEARLDNDPAALMDRMPPPQPEPRGTISRVHFPNQNPNEPGVLVMAWPAERQLDLDDSYLASLFLAALAGGETSNLYRKFIDSTTRVMDVGANQVFGWYDDDLGQPAFVGLSNIDPQIVTDDVIRKIRTVVLDEIRMIASWPADSPELAAFDDRIRNLLLEQKRDSRNLLNSPPRFGYRGTGSSWIRQLQRVRQEGFHRDLSLGDAAAHVQSALSEGGNPWTARVARWKLLDEPYVVVTTPDPEMITRGEADREARIAAYAEGLRQKYGVATDAEAIAEYQKEYDTATAEIDAAARSIELPGFLPDPPLTLDDPLQYHVTELPGGGDLVVSTFDNMTSSHAGMALSLYGVREDLLVYVPALPTILRSIGVIEDGHPMAYDEFEETLRQEIESLSVRTTSDPASGRIELLVSASGTTRPETERALHWMETALFHPDLRAENLPRIRDAVQSALGSQRNRMRGSEESWVQDASQSYDMQEHPLYLAAESFLTATHSLHRLRWMLMGADRPTAQEFASIARALAQRPENGDREELTALLGSLSAATGDSTSAEALAAVGLSADLSPAVRTLLHESATDLQKTLGDLSDQGLDADVAYLWNEMAADLATPPESALRDLQTVVGLVRHQDLARGYLVGNGADTETLSESFAGLVRRLDERESEHQTYDIAPLVDTRMMGRTGEAARPVFVGLVNPSTRSGVHIHTARCASYRDHDDESLLRFLAARLYGGGGAHSMFMQTWSAGLAYSNGLRSNERSGRLIYYAERCPDLTQTMQFVVGVLENAPDDPALAEYAVAQAFGGVRAGSRYEQRGAAMAADLADGDEPEKVAEFRRAVLALRERPDFYEELRSRMLDVYGSVLPGLGPASAQCSEKVAAHYFVIGPEKQMESWEAYLQNVEPGSHLARIYPRDFWQVRRIQEG